MDLPVAGPAWTGKKKKSKQELRKPTPSPNLTTPPFTPFASTSSLSLIPSTPPVSSQEEAPYLSHLARHHGQFTLVAPDNMGRRRQPDTETILDTQGQVEAKADRKKKKKAKKKELAAEILQAVENVGRTPSPGGSGSGGNSGIQGERRPDLGRVGSSLDTRSIPITSNASGGSSITMPEVEHPRERSYNRDSFFERLDLEVPVELLPAFIPNSPIDSHSQLLPTEIPFDPPPAYPSPSPSPLSSPDLSRPLSNQSLQSEPFLFVQSDPYVLAWEEDRIAGLSLDDRISRDLQRRTAAENAVDNSPPLNTTDAAPVILPTLPVLSIPESDTVNLDLEFERSARRELEAAEASRDVPRVARALSVMAERRTAEGTSRRRSQNLLENREDELTEVAAEPQLLSMAELSAIFGSTLRRNLVNEATPSGSSLVRISTPPQADPEHAESTTDSEEDEEEEIESRPARAPSINARSAAAAAAERRMLEERKRKLEAAVDPVVPQLDATLRTGVGEVPDNLEGEAASQPSIPPTTFVPSAPPLALPPSPSTSALGSSSASVPIASTSSLPPLPPTTSSLSRIPRISPSAVKSHNNRYIQSTPSNSPIPERAQNVPVLENFPSNRSPPVVPPSRRLPRPNSTVIASASNPASAAFASPSRRLAPLIPPVIASASTSASTAPSPAILQIPTRFMNSPLVPPPSFRQDPPSIPRRPTHLFPSRSDPVTPEVPTVSPAGFGSPPGIPNPSILSYISPTESLSLILPIQPDPPALSVSSSSPPPTSRASSSTSVPRTLPLNLRSPASMPNLGRLPIHRPLPIPPTTSTRISAFEALRQNPPDLMRPGVPVVASGARPATVFRPLSVHSISEDAVGEEEEETLGVQQDEGTLERGFDEEDFAYTDLDLLLARLEDQQRDGSNYDELLLVGEVLGPARSVASSMADIESLDVARVELQSRRIDKQGKVKQKLSVVGVRCGDCSVCLGRFRVDQYAVVLPKCLHIFHADCIRSWLLRGQQCPLCREDVFVARNVDL